MEGAKQFDLDAPDELKLGEELEHVTQEVGQKESMMADSEILSDGAEKEADQIEMDKAQDDEEQDRMCRTLTFVFFSFFKHILASDSFFFVCQPCSWRRRRTARKKTPASKRANLAKKTTTRTWTFCPTKKPRSKPWPWRKTDDTLVRSAGEFAAVTINIATSGSLARGFAGVGECVAGMDGECGA